MSIVIILLFILFNVNTFSSPLETIRIKNNKEQIHAIMAFVSKRMNDVSLQIVTKLRKDDSVKFLSTYKLMKSKINVGYSTKFIERELQNCGVGHLNQDYQCLFLGNILQRLILRDKIEELVIYFNNNGMLTDVYVLTTDNQKLNINEKQAKWLGIHRSELEEKGLLLPLSFR